MLSEQLVSCCSTLVKAPTTSVLYSRPSLNNTALNIGQVAWLQHMHRKRQRECRYGQQSSRSASIMPAVSRRISVWCIPHERACPLCGDIGVHATAICMCMQQAHALPYAGFYYNIRLSTISLKFSDTHRDAERHMHEGGVSQCRPWMYGVRTSYSMAIAQVYC